MNEPAYRWEPITDFYKEEAAKGIDIEAANEQKREELAAEKAKAIVPEKKAPLGIRIFTWYCFGRAGTYALLLLVLASFPHSDFSNWLFDSVGNFLHMPGSKSYVDSRREEMQREAQAHGFTVPDEVLAEAEGPPVATDQMHNIVMVYLLISLALTSWIGFMWWNHSWKVRWITMFYAGAMVAKAAVNFVAGTASGVGSGLSSVEVPTAMLTIALNGFVFLYLAFGPGVKQWFEEVG